MKRTLEEIAILKRRQNDTQFYCCKPKPNGAYRKNKPLGCSRPQCYICHSDKFPKRILTVKEKRAKQQLKEGE